MAKQLQKQILQPSEVLRAIGILAKRDRAAAEGAMVAFSRRVTTPLFDIVSAQFPSESSVDLRMKAVALKAKADHLNERYKKKCAKEGLKFQLDGKRSENEEINDSYATAFKLFIEAAAFETNPELKLDNYKKALECYGSRLSKTELSNLFERIVDTAESFPETKKEYYTLAADHYLENYRRLATACLSGEVNITRVEVDLEKDLKKAIELYIKAGEFTKVADVGRDRRVLMFTLDALKKVAKPPESVAGELDLGPTFHDQTVKYNTEEAARTGTNREACHAIAVLYERIGEFLDAARWYNYSDSGEKHEGKANAGRVLILEANQAETRGDEAAQTEALTNAFILLCQVDPQAALAAVGYEPMEAING